MTEASGADQVRTPTAIDAVAEKWVDTELELFPEFGVYIGRPGREGEYSDYSPAGAERAVEAVRAALAEVQSTPAVDAIDDVTKMDLARELQLSIDKHGDRKSVV